MEGRVLREISSFSPSSIGGQRRFKENSLRKQYNALIESIIGQDKSFTNLQATRPIFAIPVTVE
jgi:hypothetical protein